jgi:hypothetical protein
MAAKEESLDLTLEIDDNGEVRIASKAVLRRLAALAGRWRLLPAIGDLLLLQRVDEDPRAAARSPIALCGEIDGPGALGNVLNFIQFNQWDGILSLIYGATRKALFFKKGQVLAANSNLPEDRIGALLVRFGMIKEEDLAACIREVTPQRRLGAVLVEKGLMTAAALYDGVKRQTEEIFYSTLLVVRGTFFFVKNLDEASVPTRLHLDTQALLLEGLRRIDEMSYFRAKLPSSDVVLVRRKGAPQKTLEGDALTVYRAIEDGRSLGDIARVTHLGEFAATRAAFELVQTGFIEVHQATDNLRAEPVPDAQLPADATETIIEAYNGALARLYGTMSQKGKAASLKQGVRAFMAGSARFQDLFRGIVLGDDGTLPRKQLNLNLDGMPDGEKLELLQRGLHELLFFVLFVAGDAIDRHEEQELHERVARALEMLPRPTNPSIRRPTLR